MQGNRFVWGYVLFFLDKKLPSLSQVWLALPKRHFISNRGLRTDRVEIAFVFQQLGSQALPGDV